MASKFLVLYSVMITILYVSSMMPLYSMALGVDVDNRSDKEVNLIIRRFDCQTGESLRVKKNIEGRMCYFRGDYPNIQECEWDVIILQNERIIFNEMIAVKDMPDMFIVGVDGVVTEEDRKK